ncbi:MAG: hypothetical protein M1833_005759 [Piccolia ochrophora]|nr:MAG: hypothetical protein M1833_005759 [Piccolia ochrophora]
MGIYMRLRPDLFLQSKAKQAHPAYLQSRHNAALLGSPPEVAGAVPTPSSGLIVSTSSRAYPNLGTGLGVQPSSFTSAGVIEDVMQSATEVATPSQVYTPDIGRPRGTDRFMGEWRHTLENHAGRIDRLENVSFSNGPIEDVADRLDLFDGRIIDLEGRLEEYDRWRMIVDDENDDRRHKQIDKTHNGHSFASMTSSIRSTSSSAMIAAAIDNNAMRARMATVESKVVDLESSIIASPNHPLELEVVLLPWGRGLKGIWYPNAEILSLQSKGKSASWNRTQDEEEWAPTTTGLGNQHTAQEVNEGGWNGAAIQQWANSDDSWMFPKACGVKSTVYKRLQSRGNVRKITLHEGSARNVRRAVLNAFGDVLTVLSGNDMPTASMPAHNTDAVVDKGLLGLRSQFIPLRKVHKDSRLRFLDPDEMVSSSLWTADFLAANVVMNAVGGQSRLFITHRDGYLQYHREPRAGWTWQRLRELPRVGEAKSVGVPEADAKETCWAWDPRLDPVSVHSSFASESEHQSSFVLRSSDKSRVPTASDESESLRQSPLSNQKAMPITPVSEFPLNSALECRRTASMPMSVSVSDSRGQETSHLLSSPKKSASTSKRRCISRSPTCDGSFPEWLWKATPRRSDAASSKSSGVPIIDGVSQITAASATKRESTPFAYATPHSGLVPMEQRGSGQDFPHSDRESGEDEVLPEQQDDDAWEGMEDYEGTGDVYVPTDDDGNDDDGYESDAYMEDHS